MEGGSREPAIFRAKQHFYFVMFQHGPMQISFDGQSFAGPNASQSLIAVVPRKDGTGGELGWVIYMGDSGDPKAELHRLLESKQSADAKPSEAPEK